MTDLLIPNLITEMYLDGYVNHVHDFHDGIVNAANPTLYRVVDVEPTVQLYRWRYVARTWELLWDLRAMDNFDRWRADHKPGLGHPLCFGRSSLILGICWKHEHANYGGVLTISFLRSTLPPLIP